MPVWPEVPGGEVGGLEAQGTGGGALLRSHWEPTDSSGGWRLGWMKEVSSGQAGNPHGALGG